MLFNSYEFIFIFLPLTFFIYFYLNHIKLVKVAKGFLVFSSLFFYSWWNPIYLPIILGSMIFNYQIGKMLIRDSLMKISRKYILFFAISMNILLLAYFKYMDFFISNINFVSETNIDLYHIVLPLGISFFTFQQISYLIDSYRNETKEYDFINYALFVTFFPQLIAGPIVHHKEMMPQFARTKNKIKNYKNIIMGLFIFSMGLFKKVVIADTFSVWANAGFDVAVTLNLFEAWATSLSYTFQLYFDFSAYADMAIGSALFFNIKLPINFNSPYKSLNIQDFWKRWHITLSRFLKDYIYIPLGGNRKGEFNTYLNLITTFLLGGLWHGAGWTFIFWGFLHGVALVIYRIWSKVNFQLWTWLAWLLTFNFINITWVFFRAKEWDDAIKVLSAMFSLNNIVFKEKLINPLTPLKEYGVKFDEVMKMTNDGSQALSWILFGFIITLIFKNSLQIIEYNHNNSKYPLTKIKVFSFGVIFLISIYNMYISNHTEFIYFNF